MQENPIEGLMNTTMNSIKDMVDVNTIVGKPIETKNGIIIPLSKVTFGFASGGSEFNSETIDNYNKKEKEEFVKALFTIFDRADIKTLKDLSKNWYKKIPPIIKSMESLDDKIKKCLWDTIKVLVVFIIKNLPFLL